MTMPISSSLAAQLGAVEAATTTLSSLAQTASPWSFEQTLSSALANLDGSSTAGLAGAEATASATAPTATTSAAPVVQNPFLGLVPTSALASVQNGLEAVGPASERTAAVAAAESVLGTPYVWGGTSPQTGFDCSGLVQWAYAKAGVSLPRTAAEQQTIGVQVPSLAQAQPGDLVFYGDPAYHAAIYAGNGMVIQAPMTGENVQLAPVGDPTEIRDPTAAVGSSWTGGPASSPPASLAATFQAASAAYGLPPGMLEAVAAVESNFNPNAVSSAGAQGLMQLMPQTAASLGVNPFDPEQAIWAAAKILAGNLAAFRSVPLALAAYNAGVGAVEAYGGIPPYQQTQAYVARVLRLMGSNDATGTTTARS